MHPERSIPERFAETARNLVWIPAGLVLTGCGGGGGGRTGTEAVVVEGDFPVVFAKRDVEAVGHPIDGTTFRPRGDLLLHDLASPSAETVNLTATKSIDCFPA